MILLFYVNVLPLHPPYPCVSVHVGDVCTQCVNESWSPHDLNCICADISIPVCDK